VIAVAGSLIYQDRSDWEQIRSVAKQVRSGAKQVRSVSPSKADPIEASSRFVKKKNGIAPRQTPSVPWRDPAIDLPRARSFRQRNRIGSKCGPAHIGRLTRPRAPGSPGRLLGVTSAGAPRSIEHSRAATVLWRFRDRPWAGPSATRRPSLAIATRAEGRRVSALVRQRICPPRSRARVLRSPRLVRLSPDNLCAPARAGSFALQLETSLFLVFSATNNEKKSGGIKRYRSNF
jgi:hypothetical protein